MINIFPILRLPHPALQKLLKQMSIVDHLKLAIISKNTKYLITMLTGYPIRPDVQNFTRWSLIYSHPTLDKLLMSKFSNLMINYIDIPAKDLNIFMRHWIQGSNPHLQMINIHFLEFRLNQYPEDVLFKNINYIETTTERFERSFEILRHDRVKAVVLFNTSNWSYFRIILYR